QHTTAFGDRVGNLDQRLVEQRHRLRQVDDMDLVADTEDVLPHLRVPAMGLVAEMHASFEQLTHGKCWQHRLSRSPVRPPRTVSAIISTELMYAPERRRRGF